MTFAIKIMYWDKHKNVAGLNRLMGFNLYMIHSVLCNGMVFIFLNGQ
jgi:hypothetical protein